MLTRCLAVVLLTATCALAQTPPCISLNGSGTGSYPVFTLRQTGPNRWAYPYRAPTSTAVRAMGMDDPFVERQQAVSESLGGVDYFASHERSAIDPGGVSGAISKHQIR